MTPPVALVHVAHVGLLWAPYRGDGVWGVWWASWRTSSPWPVSWSRGARSGAGGGVMRRHRSPEGVRRGIGRPKRRRRAQLAAWDRRARQLGRERARERSQ